MYIAHLLPENENGNREQEYTPGPTISRREQANVGNEPKRQKVHMTRKKQYSVRLSNARLNRDSSHQNVHAESDRIEGDGISARY
jgi:hypothetical protein